MTLGLMIYESVKVYIEVRGNAGFECHCGTYASYERRANGLE